MAKATDKNAEKKGPRTVASNRKALHEYHILETFEAGIVLTGTEIKSVRAGRVNLQDGFVLVRNGEATLLNVHIAHYEQGNRNNHPEVHPRKLLLRKQLHDKRDAIAKRENERELRRVLKNEY